MPAESLLSCIQQGAAASPDAGAQGGIQLPSRWLARLEKNLTTSVSARLQSFWIKACEWMLLQKRPQLVPSAFWKLAKLYDSRSSTAFDFSEAFVLRVNVLTHLWAYGSRDRKNVGGARLYTMPVNSSLEKG